MARAVEPSSAAYPTYLTCSFIKKPNQLSSCRHINFLAAFPCYGQDEISIFITAGRCPGGDTSRGKA